MTIPLQSEILEWALMVLNAPLADITTIVQTPWSSVLKINTGKEVVYLKYTPELLALEANILQILRDQFHASVPTVIAHNAELHCFLMKDAGKSLRGILKQKFYPVLIFKEIDQFTSIQLTAADYVNVFLDIGVPDWRLDKLPILYKQLISQKDILIADGLSTMEINELERLFPKIFNLCQKLSNYSIKQTIVQPDFNDNNALVDEISQDITIIDFGEISISHPFFSLLNFLQQMRKHYALTDDDNTYLKIKDAYLKNYTNFETKENVLDAFETAQIVWLVYGALCGYRLMQACGEEKIMSFQHGKLGGTLKELIALCNTNDDKTFSSTSD